MLRLASSTVAPNALRAIASSRILSGSISSLSPVNRESPYISRYFSTDAKQQIDDKVVQILKSEIKSMQLSLANSVPPAPAHFPFTIQYSPCQRTATLTRELNGEKIDVVVELPRHIPEDDGEESDISDDDSNDGGGDDDNSISPEEMLKPGAYPIPPHVHLYVKVSKENGKILEFRVSACADKIMVNTMSVMEPAAQSDDRLLCFGPYIVNLDSDLQFALRKFLEIRGIKKSISGFLYMYMVKRSKRDPVRLLKKVKKFIKE